MSYSSRLSKAFQDAPRLSLTESRRYILMSDCHRGNGTSNDNFLKNRSLYQAALDYYFRNEYTYIELGDGDELWENRSMNQIIQIHNPIFSPFITIFINIFMSIVGDNKRKVNETVQIER